MGGNNSSTQHYKSAIPRIWLYGQMWPEIDFLGPKCKPKNHGFLVHRKLPILRGQI